MASNKMEEKILNEEIPEQDPYKPSNYENQLYAYYQGLPMEEFKRNRSRRSKSPVTPLEIENLECQTSLLSSEESVRNDSRNKETDTSVFKRQLSNILKGRRRSENEVNKAIIGQERRPRSSSDKHISLIMKPVLKRTMTPLGNTSNGECKREEKGWFHYIKHRGRRNGLAGFHTLRKQNAGQYTKISDPCKRLSDPPTNEWEDLAGEKVINRDTRRGGLILEYYGTY